MTDEYEIYERERRKIKKDNKKLLDNFGLWLRQKDLTEKTINKHRGNIDFYISEFLLSEDAVEAQDGVYEVGMLLADWFIRKAM